MNAIAASPLGLMMFNYGSADAARCGNNNQPNGYLCAISPVVWSSGFRRAAQRMALGQMDTDILYHCIHQAMVPNVTLATICRSNTTKFTSAKTNNVNTKTTIVPNVLLGQMDTDILYHCTHQAIVPNEALAAICRSNTTKFTSAKTNNVNTKTIIAPMFG